MSDYNFIETDTNKIYQDVIENLENECGEALYPGDERRIFGNALAFVVSSLVNSINEACRQKMLKYASGEVLDDIVEEKDLKRQEAIKATVNVRFGVEESKKINILIPKGTLVTSDFEHYFKTTETQLLYAGMTYVDILCEAENGGIDYNDALIGSIDKLASDIDIDFVTNLDVSSGGEDEEDDETLKNRYRSAPNNVSVAGPADSYVALAINANIEIADAYVTSEAPACVTIYPICYGGKIPTQEMLDQVLEACNDETVRPIGDRVTVKKPTQVQYSIEIKYYCTKEYEEEVIKNIEGDNGAISQYLAWQNSKLGRAINPDYLRKLCFLPGTEKQGADRVDIISPIYTTIEKNEVAFFDGNLIVKHEVVDL